MRVGHHVPATAERERPAFRSIDPLDLAEEYRVIAAGVVCDSSALQISGTPLNQRDPTEASPYRDARKLVFLPLAKRFEIST
jgi:hypothetical protein